MTFAQIYAEVLNRLEASSDTTYITTIMVKLWVNMAYHWVLSFKKWPHLEELGTDAIDATGKYAYPTRMKTKSAYLITVDDKRYRKIRYEDYLAYLEDESTGTDKVWAEFDNYIYINGNACDVDDVVNIYGQVEVADMTDDATTTVFNGVEPSVEEAIIRRATATGIAKYGNDKSEAISEENSAKDLANNVFDRIRENAPREMLKKTKRFRRLNVLKGSIDNRDPNNTIGNFR